jgi:predicted ATPase
MARLDRLATVKGLAQLGATLGREFSYALLQAVAPWDEATLRRGLQQLVEAELLYQQGLPPQATYVFKHALIQEAAYQALRRSTRQQHHQRIAQVLEERFPNICETQPELLAHHYTEAGILAQAISYWQQAGTRAVQRSANIEASAHVQRGLALLTTLPDTPPRPQHEIAFLTTLGPELSATKGPEICPGAGSGPHHAWLDSSRCMAEPGVWSLGAGCPIGPWKCSASCVARPSRR